MAKLSIMSTRETRQRQRKKIFDHVTEEVLEFDGETLSALGDNGISSIMDLLSLNDADISGLFCKKDNETNQPMPFHIRSKIRILQAWNFYLIKKWEIKQVDWLDGLIFFRTTPGAPFVPIILFIQVLS